ncbi:MAG: MBL fold metallo-hydrolase [Armatimonadota bacterium]
MRTMTRWALWVVLCLLVSVAWAAPLTVSVIDVGQGDSILVQFPNGQDMLVDAGDKAHGATVVNYLKSRHVTRIDILVATHPHADHIGGMGAVLAAFPVGKVWDDGYNLGSRTQQDFLQAIKKKGLQYGQPRAGFTQAIGDVRIDVLAPGKTLLGSDANNNSLVLRLVYGQTSVLLPGDMEAAERATVNNWPKTTVLKVAHHGSRNGTDTAFARALSPQVAIISYALGNSYGHPHQQALDALKAAGATVYRTGTQGTVVVTSNGKTVAVKTLGHASARNSDSASNSSTTTGSTCAYIGNRNTHVFHRPTCGHLPAEKNRVCFATREEAINAGYRPCKICNP